MNHQLNVLHMISRLLFGTSCLTFIANCQVKKLVKDDKVELMVDPYLKEYNMTDMKELLRVRYSESCIVLMGHKFCRVT